MDACDGLIVINAGAAAMIAAGATALFGFATWSIREALGGRDSHIKYTQEVNADLTETNKVLTGTTHGAVETVRKTRTGRSGQ